MNRPAIIAALLLQLVARGSVQGAEVPADTTAPRTLNDYLALASRVNPSLKSAAARARAAHERVGVARGYPDPVLLYGYYFDADDSGHQLSMKGRSEFTLMQEIPFFGKRGLHGDVATSDARVVSLAADAMALDLEYEVKMAFFELVRTNQVDSLLQEERALVERMREVSFQRYSSGTAEQYEVLKLDVTIAQIDDQAAMNEHDRDIVSARLNELIGRDAASPLPAPQWSAPETRGVEAAAVVDSAIVRRPEIAAAQAEIDAAEFSRRAAHKEYFPNFMLGLNWEFGGQKDAFGQQMGDSWEVMAGMTLPVWFGKTRAAAREAQARRESAEHGLDAARLHVSRDVEASTHGVRAARERVARFEREILPRAEQSFRSAESGYRAGRTDFLDYLDSERMWLAMRKEYCGAIAELGVGMAALERALGLSGVMEE